MNARQMFKNIAPEGKVLLCSKGGYDFGRDTFAYRISDDGKQYNITVLSEVNPRKYSVPYGEETTLETLETAIHYNEWQARRLAVMKDKEPSLADRLADATMRAGGSVDKGRVSELSKD